MGQEEAGSYLDSGLNLLQVSEEADLKYTRPTLSGWECWEMYILYLYTPHAGWPCQPRRGQWWLVAGDASPAWRAAGNQTGPRRRILRLRLLLQCSFRRGWFRSRLDSDPNFRSVSDIIQFHSSLVSSACLAPKLKLRWPSLFLPLTIPRLWLPYSSHYRYASCFPYTPPPTLWESNWWHGINQAWLEIQFHYSL